MSSVFRALATRYEINYHFFVKYLIRKVHSLISIVGQNAVPILYLNIVVLRRNTVKSRIRASLPNGSGDIFRVLPVVTNSFESVSTTWVAIKNLDCVNVESS